jgi:hypothetical protein
VNACRRCAAPVEWVRTVNGKPMPLDVGVNERGNITVDEQGVAHVGAAGSGPRISHFATCVAAPSFRRR